MEMHVKRRAVYSWRQGPIEVQNDLALGVAHSAQPQDLSGVPVPDSHESIHDSPSIGLWAPQKTSCDFIIVSNGGETSSGGNPCGPLASPERRAFRPPLG